MSVFLGSIIGNIRHGDKGNAITRAFGGGCWPIFVKRDRRWQARRIKNLLDGEGIKSWGYGQWANDRYFRVPLGDGKKAESVLKKAGLTIHGKSARGKPGTGKASTKRGAHRGAHRR